MRILLSVVIIAVLPFFLMKGTTDHKEKQSVYNVLYCNTKMDIMLEYPDTLKNISLLSENNKLRLKAQNSDLTVSLSAVDNLKSMDIDRLYASFIQKDIRSKNNPEVIYKIINDNYCEVSYRTNDQHFYEKLYHLGNKMVSLTIVASNNDVGKIDQLKSAIDLEVNVVDI